MSMRKIILTMFGCILSVTSFSQVDVKILEPIRFKNLNTLAINDDIIVGEGQFEVSTDNKEEDLGKKIVFRFPNEGFMTNKKNIIKVEKYSLDETGKIGNEKNEMIISTEREIVKFYAFVKRRDISRDKDAEQVEGEYVGYVPVVFSLYKRIGGKGVK